MPYLKNFLVDIQQFCNILMSAIEHKNKIGPVIVIT